MQLLLLFVILKTRLLLAVKITMPLTPLLLAGGRSTRMGTPKHLLPMPDGRPLYQHQIDLLARTCPDAPTIYISLAQESQLDDYLQTSPTISFNNTPKTSNNLYLEKERHHTPTITIVPDLHTNTSSQSSAGPAAGLFAALSPAITHVSPSPHCSTFVARMNRP